MILLRRIAGIRGGLRQERPRVKAPIFCARRDFFAQLNVIAACEVGIDERNPLGMRSARDRAIVPWGLFLLSSANKIGRLAKRGVIAKEPGSTRLHVEYQSTLFRRVNGPIFGAGG